MKLNEYSYKRFPLTLVRYTPLLCLESNIRSVKLIKLNTFCVKEFLLSYRWSCSCYMYVHTMVLVSVFNDTAFFLKTCNNLHEGLVLINNI